MLPKVTLFDVPAFALQGVDKTNKTVAEIRDVEKALIVNEICDKNQGILDLKSDGHTVEVVFIGKVSPRNSLTVGLKVSPAVWASIFDEQNGFVFMYGKRITVKNRFFIKQCYHCQLFGHISTDCPKKQSSPTCLYCMGPHRSSTCTVKDEKSSHSCAKCAASKTPSDVAVSKSHNSSSSDCPMYIRECRRLAQLTDFSSKNVM